MELQSDNTKPLSNDERMKILLGEVREFGRDTAAGRDALPMLALKVAYASADGVISSQKDASGSDDYARIYAEYTKADSKKAVHEHTSGGLKANVSKLRQIGNAAGMPSCDFYNTINTIVTDRVKMESEDQKVRPLYASIVEAARVQLAQPDDLTPEQIEECIKKPEADEKSVEGELKRVVKVLDQLIKGDKGPKCADQEIVDAHSLLSGKLAALVHGRSVVEAIAMANSLGLSVVVTPQGNDELEAELAA
jgi:hypothetical protein